ncbi:MAG TPA: isochorismatase family protein [Thermoanaerobaculia bacterium]|nr:isochorismatase family protein [Thermoanaerobaculia bacterium]
MLHSSEVPVGESALLVVDAQDSFKVTPRWERRSNHAFETNVQTLIDAYRQAGLPVIFFLHTDEDDGFTVDSPHFKLMDFIVRRPDEPLIVKNTRNCFTSTGLGALLLAKGIRRLAITGIQMEQCCETTARLAADLGYAVDFVTDGTMTFPIPNVDRPGEELGVEDIKTRTEYALRQRFARLTSAAQLAAEVAADRASRSSG